MAYFIALGILSLVGIVGTVWLVRTDGYGRIPTDPSRVAPESRASRVALSASPAAETARPTLPVAPAAVSASTTPLRVIAAE